jgi:N12 class adenine-specific DNA methylase
MAKAFDPYERTPAWQQLGARLRELLTPEDGTAAQQATATSFYTSPTVTAAIWRVLVGLGFAAGQVLEPGCGSGLFIAATPAGLPVTWTGVERDPVSARIAGLLHPHARIITAPLERVSLPPAGFAAAVGNVPFADVCPYDPTAPKKLSLHNYFIWRAVQAVHPGGLVAVVTSRFTLDGEDPRARELLARDADLIGAVRLPSGAFREYGTDVVTDILVLRRRSSPPTEGAAPPLWLTARRQPELRTAVSAYFLAHPEQVLGRFEAAGGAYHGQVLDVVFDGDRGSELEAALTAAVERIVAAGVQQHHTYRPRRDPTAIPDDVVLVDKAGRKDGSFHLVNGIVHQVAKGQLVRVARGGAELVALIQLRDATLALLDAEADPDTSDQTLAPLRATLNRRYDRYVATYGPLNRCTLIQGPPDEDTGLPTWTRRRPPTGGFRDDPDYVTVLALELYDDDTRTAAKAPIFHQRVNRRPQRPERASDAADAVALCLDEHGHLDIDTIARLLAISPLEVPAALGDLAYHDPAEQRWVPADEYLSGDVRERLDVARVAAARGPEQYSRNVAALAVVQPADLGPEEIRVKLGAPWVEACDIQAFLVETVGGQVAVRHEPLTASWEVKVDRWTAASGSATAEWGTGRIDAYELVQLACNGGAPVVYDEFERADGSTARVRNVPETMLAEAKLQALNERFATWMWEDPERTDRLVDVYNRRYNATVLRRFDGSHLTFPGLADWFIPYQAQRDITYRIAATAAALCGFVVGGGKTAAMFMSAVTLRRLGLAAKPMIICPNHLLEQTAQEGKRLFPSANILMVSREDLGKERRKRFAARCAVGDWDTVVITQSAFTALAVHPDTEAAWLATQIQLYRRGHGPRRRGGAAQPHRQADRQAGRPAGSPPAGAAGPPHRRRCLLRAARRRLPASGRGPLLQAARLPDPHGRLQRRGVQAGHRPGPQAVVAARAQRRRPLRGVLHRHPDQQLAGRAVRAADLPDARPARQAAHRQLRRLRRHVHRVPHPDRGRARRRLVPAAPATGKVHERPRAADAPGRDRRHPHPRHARAGHPRRRLQHRGGARLPRAAHVRGRAGRAGRQDPRRRPIQARRQHAVGLQRRPPSRAGPGVGRHPDRRPRQGRRRRRGGRGHLATDRRQPVPGQGRGPLACPRRPAGRVLRSRHAQPQVGHAGVRQDPPRPDRRRDPRRSHPLCPHGQDRRSQGRPVRRLPRRPRGGLARQHRQARRRHQHPGPLHRHPPRRRAVATRRRRAAGGACPAPRQPQPPRADHPLRHRSSFDSYMWQTLERKARFIAQILTGELTAREVEDVDTSALSYAEVKALATGQPLLLEAATVAAEIARLRNLAVGHTRAQRRVQDDTSKLLRQAEAFEEQARSLDAVAEHAARQERVFSRYGSGPLADRAAIAKALGAAAADALQRGSPQHPGQWAGLSLTITPTSGWRDAALEVTLTAGYRDSAAFEVPKSWLQQGQQWRIVDALERLIDQAPGRAGELRDAAAAHRARAADSQQLLGRPFEHADKLKAALARQEEIDAAMRADAEAAANPQEQPAADAPSAAEAPTAAG